MESEIPQDARVAPNGVDITIPDEAWLERDRIRVEFRKLDVKAGDTLIARVPADMDDADKEWFADVMSEELNRVEGEPSPTLLIISDEADLAVLDEDQMRAAGWVRGHA